MAELEASVITGIGGEGGRLSRSSPDGLGTLATFGKVAASRLKTKKKPYQ